MQSPDPAAPSLFVADGAENPVTHIELFFDLIFVLAITQLSHTLLDELNPAGALKVGVMFLAVWWLWLVTAWSTNRLDTETVPVRLLLIAMMAGGLVLSSAIGEGFEEGALPFAVAYVALQLGRTLFLWWAARATGGMAAALWLDWVRQGAWFLLAAPLWIGGALVGDLAQLAMWGLAVAIEYAAPALHYRVPGLGPANESHWRISGEHLAERCALIVIIALGEAVLITGAAFADGAQTASRWHALFTSFIASAALWWLYFAVGARRATERLEEGSLDTVTAARTSYTWVHLLIIAGIVVTAVADELMLAHPLTLDPEKDGAGPLAYIIVALGGPATSLLGIAIFKRQTGHAGRLPPSHLTGLAALGIAAAIGRALDATPLDIGRAVAVILIAVAVWEWIVTARMRNGPAPEPRPDALTDA